MFIETTINIQIDCLIKLSEAARHTGRSRSGIIMHLMKYVMDIRQEQVRCGTRVRYQERGMDDRVNIHLPGILKKIQQFSRTLQENPCSV